MTLCLLSLRQLTVHDYRANVHVIRLVLLAALILAVAASVESLLARLYLSTLRLSTLLLSVQPTANTSACFGPSVTATVGMYAYVLRYVGLLCVCV